MNAADIVAYTYKAELYTPLGVVRALIDERRLSPAAVENVEDSLDMLAETEALEDWEHEDSDIYPQPVFADQIDDDTTVLDYHGNREPGAVLKDFAKYGEL